MAVNGSARAVARIRPVLARGFSSLQGTGQHYKRALSADLALGGQSVRGFLWGRPGTTDLASYMGDEMRRMEREMDRWFSPTRWPRLRVMNLRPWRVGEEHPAEEEWFRLRNPIVEENGVKKMKLVFDLRRFKPEEISVKTKGNQVMVEAKHESKEKDFSSHFEFRREFTVPEGVKPEEVTCKYLEDGGLALEAPYTPPPEALPASKETSIKIQHEK